MLIDMCVLVWLLACTPGMHPDMWEEWWRPACVLHMQPDMWSTRCRRAYIRSHAKRRTGCHQPEADWLVSPINTPRPQLISSHPDLSKPTPRDGSVQLNSSRPLSSFDDQVEMLSGVSSVLRACQFLHGEAEVLSKSSPVHPSQVVPWVPVIFKDSVVAGGRTIWSSLVFPRPRTQRVQGNPLFAGSRALRETGSWPMSEWLHDEVLTLSPKSGLGIACEGWWILKLCGSRYLEVGLWQEAKSNLVTVALGKDDWIAWCWTLGSPV
ncbi:hypothetical protein YC2023_117276 [Brassica napus]